jgi:hypothetical protein
MIPQTTQILQFKLYQPILRFFGFLACPAFFGILQRFPRGRFEKISQILDSSYSADGSRGDGFVDADIFFGLIILSGEKCFANSAEKLIFILYKNPSFRLAFGK